MKQKFQLWKLFVFSNYFLKYVEVKLLFYAIVLYYSMILYNKADIIQFKTLFEANFKLEIILHKNRKLIYPIKLNKVLL